ncbi:pheromone [Trametes versicolor FP-101664 SS1]|nr:pheromone [Trametes versicolor FP-101664 SS1]EIW57108.1 pheromone [Trametes versicolor FP-101664 SS1]
MDAFFVIAAPVPAEDASAFPEVDIFADHDSIGTNGTHGSCIIA